MVICSKCGELKEPCPYKYKGQVRFKSYCRDCDRIQRKAGGYRKAPLRQQLLDEIRNSPCVVCGLVEPVVMDLHHVEERIKRDNTRMSWMSMVNGRESEFTYLLELAKCVLLCANDHKRVHAGKVDLTGVPRRTYNDLEARLREIERERLLPK